MYSESRLVRCKCELWSPERRIHYGCAVRMGILSARTRNSLRMRSESANFECQNAEFTTDAQRKCKLNPKSPRKRSPNDPRRGRGSPKRVLAHFLIQTLKANRHKNDPRENSENKPNECWIPTNRLKRRIRYETAAKMQKIDCKANAWNYGKHYFSRVFSKMSASYRSSVHQCALLPLSRAQRFWQMLWNP